MESFDRIHLGRFGVDSADSAGAVRLAGIALVTARDPDALGLARAIAGLVIASWPDAAAVAAGGTDAADAWNARAKTLAGHPISAPTVDRIESRIALLKGDTGRAVSAAQRAIERAVEDGRGIEAAEGEILLARVRLAGGLRGEGARQLAVAAGDADAADAWNARRRKSCAGWDGDFLRRY